MAAGSSLGYGRCGGRFGHCGGGLIYRLRSTWNAGALAAPDLPRAGRAAGLAVFGRIQCFGKCLNGRHIGAGTRTLGRQRLGHWACVHGIGIGAKVFGFCRGSRHCRPWPSASALAAAPRASGASGIDLPTGQGPAHRLMELRVQRDAAASTSRSAGGAAVPMAAMVLTASPW